MVMNCILMKFDYGSCLVKYEVSVIDRVLIGWNKFYMNNKLIRWGIILMWMIYDKFNL